jgi:hypothetical protein
LHGFVAAQPRPDGVLEDAVQQAEVVERQLQRLAAAPARGDERLDVVRLDALQRPVAEERRQVHPQEGLVALQRRALAPEALEVREQPRARLGDRQALRDRGLGELGLHAPAQRALGLRPGQPLAGAGRARQPELAIHTSAVDAPAAVPVARLLIQRAAAVAPSMRHLLLPLVGRPGSPRSSKRASMAEAVAGALGARSQRAHNETARATHALWGFRIGPADGAPRNRRRGRARGVPGGRERPSVPDRWAP